MKIVYLVRHAKSSWDQPNLDDFDRSLNNRGKKDAPEMGKRLKKKKIMPDIIVASPAKRAAKTARKMAKEMDYPRKNISFLDPLYLASSQDLLRVLQNTSPAVDSIMLFGHNPGLTDFANMLSESSIENIVTAGVYALQLATDNWQQVKANKKARLLFYEYPKKKAEEAG